MLLTYLTCAQLFFAKNRVSKLFIGKICNLNTLELSSNFAYINNSLKHKWKVEFLYPLHYLKQQNYNTLLGIIQ